jgi:hypothetical protein
MPLFDTRASAGTFTFSNSTKHVALYQRFGFWPHFPTAISQAPPTAAGEPDALVHARGPRAKLAGRVLTDAIHPGLDLARKYTPSKPVARRRGRDARSGRSRRAGHLSLRRRPEAGSGACYVKPAAIRPGPHAPERFATAGRLCRDGPGMRRRPIHAGVNTLASASAELRRGAFIDPHAGTVADLAHHADSL